MADEILAYRITLDEGQSLKSIKELVERNKELKKTLESAGASGKEEFEKLAQEFSKNKKLIDEFRRGIVDFATTSKASLQPVAGSYSAIRKEQTELIKQLKAMKIGDSGYAELFKQVKSNQLQLDNFNRDINSSGNIVADYGGKVGSIFMNIGKEIATGLAIGGILAFSQTIIKLQSEISDLQADIRKTAGLTADEVQILTQNLQKIDTRTSLQGLLEIAKVGGQLGIPKAQLEAFVKSVDKANVALGDEFKGGIEEVAREIGGLQRLFKDTKNLQAGDAINRIGSAVNSLGAAGSATGPVIVEFTKRIGALGNMAPSITQTLGLGAAFQELGLSAEIASGGLTNILLKAGEESDQFAKFLQIPLNKFKELLNTNPNEMLLKLAERFKGASNTDIIKTLQNLKIGTQESIKVMSLLANQTDFVREKQALASAEMQKATSLTDEFNIKNNTFAAQIEKGYKNIQAFLLGLSDLFAVSIGRVLGFFSEVAKGLASIVTPTKDYLKVSSDVIRTNKEQATTAQGLVNEYDKLKNKTNLTKEEKKRLEEITLQLRDALGESVVAINKETGALELNRAAVQEAIKQKLLMANNEASTLALKANTLKQDIALEAERNKQLKKELAIRTDLLRKNSIEERKNDWRREGKSESFIKERESWINPLNPADIDRRDKQFDKYPKYVQQFIVTEKALKENNKKLEADRKEYERIINELKKLGYSQKDIDKLFNPEIKKPKIDPKNELNLDKNSSKEKNRAEKTAKELLDIELNRIKELEKLRLAELERNFLESEQTALQQQQFEAQKLAILNESATAQIQAIRNAKITEKEEISKNNKEIAELELAKVKHTKVAYEKQKEIVERSAKERQEKIIKGLEEEQRYLQERLFFAEAEIKGAEMEYEKGLLNREQFEKKKQQIITKFAIENEKIGENIAIGLSENNFLEGDMALLENMTLSNEKRIQKIRLDNQREFEIDKLNIQRQSLENQLDILREKGVLTIGEEARINNEILKIRQQIAVKTSEGNLQDAQRKRQLFQEMVNYAQQLADLSFQVAEAQLQKQIQQDEERKRVIEEKTQASINSVQALEKELETADSRDKRRILQEIEAEKQKQAQLVQQAKDTEKQIAEEKKRMAIMQAIINTALSVTAFLARGDIAGSIAAGITGAIQVGIIQGQKFATGGLLEMALRGKRYADGGSTFPSRTGGVMRGGSHASGRDIPFVVGNSKVIHRAEGGEFIVNKKSTEKYLPLLEIINNQGLRLPIQHSFGTPYYATGGMITQINGNKESTNQKEMVEELKAMRNELRNLKINLSMVELQEKQVQLKTIEG